MSDFQNIELLKECPFQFSKDKKIGHLRADFDGGRSTKAFNTWHPEPDWEEKLEEYNIDKQDIQEAVNWVIFNKVDTFDKVVELSGGRQGLDNISNYYFQNGNCDYWVRLIPIKDDYNIYVNVYHK